MKVSLKNVETERVNVENIGDGAGRNPSVPPPLLADAGGLVSFLASFLSSQLTQRFLSPGVKLGQIAV